MTRLNSRTPCTSLVDDPLVKISLLEFKVAEEAVRIFTNRCQWFDCLPVWNMRSCTWTCFVQQCSWVPWTIRFARLVRKMTRAILLCRCLNADFCNVCKTAFPTWLPTQRVQSTSNNRRQIPSLVVGKVPGFLLSTDDRILLLGYRRTTKYSNKHSRPCA